jgi:hemoglobin/transferrin/lactoferrin receptor protein
MRLTYSNSNIKVDGSASGSYEALDLGAPIGQVVALQVQHSLPQYNMLVGGSIDIALDYDDTEATSDLALDGYEVVSAFAEYYPERWDGVTIRASVDNIFDQKYADRATYGADYADVVPLNEPGRTFVLEAVARF